MVLQLRNVLRKRSDSNYVIFDRERYNTSLKTKLNKTIKGINKMKRINESSRMTDQDILNWIGQEVSEAEWCSDMTFDDYDAILEVETNDGDRFEIIVKPMESGSKEDVMLESENVPTNVKVDLVELIETYAKEMVNKAKGDRTAGMAAKIAHDKLMDLISSL